MAPLNDDRLTTLYRLFNGEELLYIGISSNFISRFNSHKKEKPWWEEVNRVDLQHFGSRSSALHEEEQAIKTEKPKYNVIHNSATKQIKTTAKLNDFNLDDVFEDNEDEWEDEDGVFKGAFLISPVRYNVTLHIETELPYWVSFTKNQGNDEWFYAMLRTHRGDSGIYIHYDGLEMGHYIEADVHVDSLLPDLRSFIYEFEKACGEGVMRYWIERTERQIDFDNSIEINKGRTALEPIDID